MPVETLPEVPVKAKILLVSVRDKEGNVIKFCDTLEETEIFLKDKPGYTYRAIEAPWWPI
jgi:hypothetical protein